LIRFPSKLRRRYDSPLTKKRIDTMNGINDVGALIFATLIFLAIPGPGTIKLLTSMGERNGGARAGVWSTLGLMMGDLVWMALALSGVAALAAAHPRAFDALRVVGALYLAWIGWQLIRATLPRNASKTTETAPQVVASAGASGRGPWQWFREACLVSLSNPKVIGFYVAFFPLFIDQATFEGVATYVRMIGLVLTLAFCYCMFLITVAQFAKRLFLARPALGAWLQRFAGAALIGFSIKFATQR
jgi:leucine efflux protein